MTPCLSGAVRGAPYQFLGPRGSRITILRGVPPTCPLAAGDTAILFDDLKQFGGRRLLGLLLRFREVRVLCHRLSTITSPFATALLFRLLTYGQCRLEDTFGDQRRITAGYLLSLLAAFLREWFKKGTALRSLSKDLSLWEAQQGDRCRRSLDLAGIPVYLRTDMAFGVRAGGSLGHIAGVTNNLGHFAKSPILLTTDPVPGITSDVTVHCILPSPGFWNFSELPSLLFTDGFCAQARHLIGTRVPLAFFYQRYSRNNYSGVKLAEVYQLPFVLEYNGSEVWMRRHWARATSPYDALTERIEMLNLQRADLIVVVSRPMKDELVSRGIEEGRILVNPNGVDPTCYAPGVDGTQVRGLYGLEDRVVIGFIGTFGPWHGAEVLAAAFGILIGRCPEYRSRLRLLMVGDGPGMPAVKTVLALAEAENLCTLTGLVPQELGPAHLAACDILVASHVPNPDGTPFFGSPTKLFEYMAMGKGIVASNLDQLGEVLDHAKTAWLVEPGDAGSLAEGLKVLVDDPGLRQSLGQAARREVLGKYTWREHTHRIIEKLVERCN